MTENSAGKDGDEGVREEKDYRVKEEDGDDDRFEVSSE